MERYFLINTQGLSDSVARTALLQIKRSSNADAPRLTGVDVDGFYFATTMSIGQLNLFHGFLSDQNVPFKVLTERPKLKAAAPESTDKPAPQVPRDADEIFAMVEQAFDRVDKLLEILKKPK